MNIETIIILILFLLLNKHGFANSDEYDIEKNKMLKSIYENGGFWIGRYEAGIEGSIENFNLSRKEYTEITNLSAKAISRQGAIPYNNIKSVEAQKLAKIMTPNDKITSSLMFGIQWDLTLKYIEEKGYLSDNLTKITSAMINSNSGSWGNYMTETFYVKSGKYAICSSSYVLGDWNVISNKYEKSNTGTENMVLLATGIAERNKTLNIYDLAGNLREFTLETSIQNSQRAISCRGGCYNYNDENGTTAFSRANSFVNSFGGGTGFRSTLY